MNKIEKLISQLCPNGVEYKELLEVCSDFIVPMRDRPQVFDGDIPWCRIEDIQGDSIHGSLSGLKVSKRVISDMNLKVMPTGTVIASCSASLGRYAITTTPLITNQTFIGLVCGERLLNRYLLHLLPLKTRELVALSNSGTIPYISRAKFEKLRIPVPPIEVQQEIVNILDILTELVGELEAELAVRRIQFAQLLDEVFDNEEIRTSGLTKLAEHGEFDRGNGLQKVDFSENGVGCIHYGQIYTKFGSHASEVYTYVPPALAAKLKKVTRGNLVITTTSENTQDVCKAVAWLGDGEIVIGGHACVYRHRLDPLFATYLFRSRLFQNQKNSYVQGTKVKDIKPAHIGKIEVYVPPMKKQIEIGLMMRNFDALVEDVTIGLPAEITARRKQYEYYRNKLLTFKVLGAA